MTESSATTPTTPLTLVTFGLPAAVQAETIALCGEFNDWATDATFLERAEDGTWSTAVALTPGQSYRFRYLIDGANWENDWAPDSYAFNDHGGYDSVVVVPDAD